MFAKTYRYYQIPVEGADDLRDGLGGFNKGCSQAKPVGLHPLLHSPNVQGCKELLHVRASPSCDVPAVLGRLFTSDSRKFKRDLFKNQPGEVIKRMDRSTQGAQRCRYIGSEFYDSRSFCAVWSGKHLEIIVILRCRWLWSLSSKSSCSFFFCESHAGLWT